MALPARNRYPRLPRPAEVPGRANGSPLAFQYPSDEAEAYREGFNAGLNRADKMIRDLLASLGGR